MPTTLFWLSLLAAYLSGSVPFAFLLGKARGVDIRQAGSGNIGATNLGRICGKKWGVAGFALDTLKGALPVLVAGFFRQDFASGDAAPWLLALLWVAVGIAAVLGHVFPVWLGFKGGKGVATSLGVLLGFWPVLTLPGLAAGLIWVGLCYATGFVSLASVLAAASVPPLAYAAAIYFKEDRLVFGGFALMLALLVVFKHRANIARLKAGTEPKAGWTGKA
jgi:glycerol-3-phosphate acyltransferase PlsY